MSRNETLAVWRDKNREKLREYQRAYMRARRAANPEKARAEGRIAAKKRRLTKQDEVNAYGREFYYKRKNSDPEKYKQKCAEQRERHKDKIRNIARKWAALNPEKKAYDVAKRRARIKNAIPSWADINSIKKIYKKCAQISSETGIQHQVDHIIPLQGNGICGLHVHWNLQIIPAIENQRKSNKLIEAA